MKPKEFDELVRQKFDQNDFAYSPKSWDSLAEQLDGRAKKRSFLMWLWMPALGMAASVAMAVGVTGVLRITVPGANGVKNEYTQTSRFVKHQHHQAVAMVEKAEAAAPAQSSPVAPVSPVAAKIVKEENTKLNNVGIKLSNVLNAPIAPKALTTSVNLAVVPSSNQPQSNAPKTKKQPVTEAPGYKTFAHQEMAVIKKPAKFSIILSGGINQGSGNSGYSAGATVRRMINDKVYVEGDVAFASSDMVQNNQYARPVSAAKVAGAAKVSKVESNTSSTSTVPENTQIRGANDPYNLCYAQITPSIGYNVMKRMSIAAGPDFQQALADKRPAVSADYRGNIQVAPLFDVGLIGKTEYRLTKRVKAAVSYRKGINSVIATSDKFIDRDYLQFQLKCVILNK